MRGDADSLAGVKPGWWAEADGSFDARGRFVARRVKVREEIPGGSFADRVQRTSLTESSTLDGSGRMLTNLAIVDYVRTVGARVVPAGATPAPPYSFGIIRDPTLNAFALPNGSIYVHTGLLARLDNEAQLAIVLGHEVAHVTGRHGQRQYRAGVSAFLPAQIGAVILGVQFGRRSSGPYPQLMVGLGLELGVSAAVNGYGRGLEDQADRVGLRYAVEAGYDPAEGPKIWVTFNDVTGDEGSVENFFYGNHATNEVRKENLESEIDRHYAGEAPSATPPLVNGDVYQATMLDLIRENAVADYDLKRYHLASKGFDRVLAHRPGDPVAHHYTGLILVATDESPDGAARAAAEFLRALAVAPDYAPAHRDLGRLYARTGRTTDARAHLGRYLELAPEDAQDRGDVEKELARLLQEAGGGGEAHQEDASLLRLRVVHAAGRRVQEVPLGERVAADAHRSRDDEDLLPLRVIMRGIARPGGHSHEIRAGVPHRGHQELAVADAGDLARLPLGAFGLDHGLHAHASPPVEKPDSTARETPPPLTKGAAREMMAWLAGDPPMDQVPAESELIYDWNRKDGFAFRHSPHLELNDESLRDGCQSPSVTDPPIEDKLRLVHLMEKLEIRGVDIGLPGAGPRALADITRIVEEIRDHRMKIRPNCAVRTVVSDVQALVEVSQATGVAVEACAFIGSSSIRQLAESWSLDHILRLSVAAVEHGVKNGLPVTYVTEDTTRATPDAVRRLYSAAIEAGATRICVCDTVGHATPIGVRHLLKFVKKIVAESGERVFIDWHGHSDRGLAIPNSMMAIATGADRIHATALGVGERCGNTPMDQLLVNLRLEGIIDTDLTSLDDYVRTFSRAAGVPIPINYPVMGDDAFRTATGVHAAAIIKARRIGEDWLADRVYSGVPASMVGRTQKIEIGFMSGASNVSHWLAAHDVAADKDLVDAILAAAKERTHVLTDDEILAIVRARRA